MILPRHGPCLLPAPARAAILLGGLLATCPASLSAAADAPRHAAGGKLPIEVLADPRPQALHAWHLFWRDDASAVVGERVAFVGQVDADSSRVILRQPPWLIVSPERGAEPGRTWQIFSVALAALPRELDADGFGRFEGILVAAAPDAKTGEPGYRLEAPRAEAIRLARPVAALAGDVPGIVRLEEDRLRAVCIEHGLRYDFDADPTGMSWYDGRIAFTARLSTHPGFSFKPVPYATVSVLFDPATGEPDRLVVTRRLWADPPD